jgi:hypothetical protein
MRVSPIRGALKRLFPAGARLYRQARSLYWRKRSGVGSVAVFDEIMRDARWGSEESQSGEGSNLEQTAQIREHIPRLLATLGTKSMLDAPCGDWYWMQHVDLGGVDYTGADLVTSVVESCQQRFETPDRRFVALDIVKDPLPKVDIILCRDCLVHLSYGFIFAALRNFRASGSTYLLTTTFPQQKRNLDIRTGDWRPLNLQKPPFNFPPPLELIDENCTQENGAFRDKSLALWRLDALPLV